MTEPDPRAAIWEHLRTYGITPSVLLGSPGYFTFETPKSEPNGKGSNVFPPDKRQPSVMDTPGFYVRKTSGAGFEGEVRAIYTSKTHGHAMAVVEVIGGPFAGMQHIYRLSQLEGAEPSGWFAADEIERLRAERQWQPIETAPKDGTKILVTRAHPTSGNNPAKIAWSFGEAWRIRANTGLRYAPTHWMPLPQPPKGDA